VSPSRSGAVAGRRRRRRRRDGDDRGREARAAAHRPAGLLRPGPDAGPADRCRGPHGAGLRGPQLDDALRAGGGPRTAALAHVPRGAARPAGLVEVRRRPAHQRPAVRERHRRRGPAADLAAVRAGGRRAAQGRLRLCDRPRRRRARCPAGSRARPAARHRPAGASVRRGSGPALGGLHRRL
ncbi:MAG: hypothetical protein AVDCRST_MAG36-3088, partial [uncultured Nocardioidaceae bacterium]